MDSVISSFEKDYVINLVVNGDHRRLLHLSENTVKSNNAGNSVGISTTADEILKTEGGVCQSKENRVVRVRLRDDGQAYQLSFTLTKKTSETICPALCRRSRLVVTPMSTQKTGKDGLATSMRIVRYS
ncbi:Mitochondrial outer membrane protein porin [Trichinella spiralis]|uniref:Mitochondrial outer membrane protein porin n=1 Tax=Trichinella spiralis TaxID=6334 RepID=A0ABR3KDJ1_TRISP